MNDWFTTLAGTQQRVWGRLAQAANENALISFATVSAAGAPEVRTVVLRDVNKQEGTLAVFTDLQSDKISSLTAHPSTEIVFWDEALRLQIRAACDVQIRTGEPVMNRWAKIPDHSKLSYGITPAPGTIIADSKAYKKEPDPNVFAVLECVVQKIDAVHLGRPHRRAQFLRADASQMSDWSANWLAP